MLGHPKGAEEAERSCAVLWAPRACCVPVASFIIQCSHTAQPGTSLHPSRGQLLDGTELQLLVLVQKALFS